MKKMMLAAVILAALLCTVPAWTQGPPQGPPPGFGGPRGMGGGMMMSCPAMAVIPPQSAMIDRLADQLQLTEDQSTKLSAVMTKSETNIKTLSQKAGDASKALREAIMAAEFDGQKVKDLATAAEKAEADIVSARIDEWTQIRGILSADQIKTLQEAMSQQRQGPGQRPAGAPAGPPPGPQGFPPPPDQNQ